MPSCARFSIATRSRSRPSISTACISSMRTWRLARWSAWVTTTALPETIADIVVEDEQEHSSASLRLLADGAIVAFEALRHLRRADGTTMPVHTWVRSLDRTRRARRADRLQATGVATAPDSFTGELPGRELRLSGPVVVGSLDLDMRVQRLGNDVLELLGEQPDALLGQPLVERMHRDDVGAFLLVPRPGDGRRRGHVDARSPPSRQRRLRAGPYGRHSDERRRREPVSAS